MVSAIVIYITAFFVPLLLSLVVLPFHIRFMKKKKIVGTDIHKESQPKVAEMGGIIILLTMIIGSVIAIFIVSNPSDKLTIGIFCITITIAGIIGLIDDFKPLSAIIKPILLLFASIPIIVSKRYISEPMLPFVGKMRLNIVYLALLPFVVSIPANAVNMLDVFNGSMATTSMLVLVAIAIASGLIFGFNFTELNLTYVFLLITLGALLAFWFFNRYPAKVFAGDTGSLTIGAAIGTIAVLGQLEIVVIIAMIPFIMNAFGTLSSVKGLVERRKMPARPTSMTEDWKLQANPDPKAPITLVGIVLQKGPLREDDVVKSFNILTILSCILAIVTAVLIKVTIK